MLADQIVLLALAAVLAVVLVMGIVHVMRTPRRVAQPPDPREWLRENRRREMAEWDAEFRRLGGGVIVNGVEYEVVAEYEVVRDWGGRVVRRIGVR